jgi:hypothetical protein
MVRILKEDYLKLSNVLLGILNIDFDINISKEGIAYEI